MSDNLQGVHVVREDGVAGQVSSVITSDAGPAMVVVRFEDGAELAVSPQMLASQADGSYRLLLAGSQLTIEDDVVIPVVVEEVTVGAKQITRGVVRVHKRVATQEQVVDAPISSEEVVVEHLPINALVQGEPPQIREEDGAIIIPVMLREEVRLTKRVTISSVPQTVVLRQEIVDIERIEGNGRD
jgi:hypothetical protein